jgi:hypothetical protein
MANSPSTPPDPPGVGMIRNARFMARLRKISRISWAGRRLSTTITGRATRQSQLMVEKKNAFNTKTTGFFRRSCE